MKKCPKCGTKMERWFGILNKRDWSDDCPKCGYIVWSAEGKRKLERSIKDMREGRTYHIACALKRGKCQKSGLKPTLCSNCSTEDARKWYRLGMKDERKRQGAQDG